KQCRDIMGKMLADSEVRLTLDVAPEFTLIADRRALRQMLLNLLSNALKYSRPQGEIRVTAAIDRDGGSVISVIDRGAGIEPERLARIAEPSPPAATTTRGRRAGPGSGSRSPRASSNAMAAG